MRYRELLERFETVEWPSDQIPDLKYWSNPRLSEIQRAIQNSRQQCLRGVVDAHTGISYVWDAYTASHEDFCALLNITYEEGEMYPSLIAPDENTLAMESDWGMGSLYRTERGNLFVQVIDETYFNYTESAFGEHFFVREL